MESPYTAKLTYEFFLPEGEIWKEYQKDIEILVKKQQKGEFWNLIKRKYVRKYISRIYGGDVRYKKGQAKFFYPFIPLTNLNLYLMIVT